MGKAKEAISVIAIILGSTSVVASGGGAAYNALNQAKDGVDGKAGTVWNTGTENIESVAIGNEGDFYYDVDDYKLYQVENGSWTLKVENFGKQGIQGIQGIKGEQGDQGVQGEQGIKGEKGDQGVQGVKGEKGDQGIQGVAGSDGEKGDQGVKGDQGDPGINGTNGTDGTSYYTWIKYSDAMPTSDADLKQEASNFIGVYSGTASTAPTTYSSYNWFEIKGAKGDKGDTGDQGDKGENGKNGVDAYIGYDGNIWYGKNRTELKLGSIGEFTTEDTIGLYNNGYFSGELVDTVNNQIALTGEYYENIEKFIYSNLDLDKITVCTCEAGDLVIGTIDFSTGQITQSKKYAVTYGVCEIDVSDISVGEKETIFLGGGETNVRLYKKVGVENAADTYGNFTVIPEMVAPAAISVNNSKTGNVLDKLLVKVEVTGSVIPDSTTLIDSTSITTGSYTINNLTSVDQASGPYRYVKDYFSGKTITRIGVPVKDFNNGTFNLYVLKKSIGNLNGRSSANYVNLYTITLPKGDTTPSNEWVYVDVTNLNISVASDETLSFDYASGGANWGYKNVSASTDYNFYTNTSTTVCSAQLLFVVEGYTTSDATLINLKNIRKALEEANAE